MAVKKDQQQLQREYEARGWTIERTGNNHLRWKPPGGGQPIFSSATPSEWRSLKNLRARLRRAEKAAGRQAR